MLNIAGELAGCRGTRLSPTNTKLAGYLANCLGSYKLQIAGKLAGCHGRALTPAILRSMPKVGVALE